MLKRVQPKAAGQHLGVTNVRHETWRLAIYHESMPVLLTKENEFETWLTGSPQEAFELVKPFDPDRMRIVQEGFEKKINLLPR